MKKLSVIAGILALFPALFIFFVSSLFVSPTFGGIPSQYAINEIPTQFLPIYQAAAAKYGIDWEVLAAIHKVETNFSRDFPMISIKGALGPMQFMPGTWDDYKVEAGDESVSEDYDYDVWEEADAIHTAANFLDKQDYKNDPGKALWYYNQSWNYVAKVLELATRYSEQFAAGLPGANGWAWPAPGFGKNDITSEFGLRWGRNHGGIDIAMPKGSQVVAAYPGKFTRLEEPGGFGYYVRIDHANGTSSYYGHLLEQASIADGTEVTVGQFIGLSGNSGHSTGPHLHFEIKVNGAAVDPLTYVVAP